MIKVLRQAARIDPQVIEDLHRKYQQQIGRLPVADRPALRAEVATALAALLAAGPSRPARHGRSVSFSDLLPDYSEKAYSGSRFQRRIPVKFFTSNNEYFSGLRLDLAGIEKSAAPQDSASEHGPEAAEARAERYFAPEIDPPSPAGLVVGRAYTLAVRVKVGEAPPGQQPIPEVTLFPNSGDRHDVPVTVQLDSDDCDIPGSNTQSLTIPFTGPSPDKARFAVVPREKGNCRLTATIHRAGLLIQKLDVTLVVGAQTLEQPTVRAVGPVPRLADISTERGIGLHFENTKEGFKCTAFQAICSVAELNVDLVALEAIVTRLRAALLRLVTDTADDAGKAIFQAPGKIPKWATDQALHKLAPLGADLFQALFFGTPTNPVGKDIGRWLRRVEFGPDRPRLISITSDKVFLPWALMYLGEDLENPTWDGFLGMRHVVEHLPLANSGMAVSSTEISRDPALRISLNLNQAIDAELKSHVVANQRRYWRDVARSQMWVRVESRLTADEFLTAMSNGQTPDQVMYLYCHASTKASASSIGDSSLRFSDGRSLTLTELRRRDSDLVQLAGNPLVFLNACESAQMSPTFYNGFAPYFFEKGCRGVIGTECKAPSYFAADWARNFFKLFFDGLPVGLIIHRLRRQYLDKSGNPLGLLYGVYCNADTRLGRPDIQF
ncbi:MAG TPA: CHAT domain-containing protein [Streptosporangiaceae bacterium]|nr:CHAT domain-containing protein [Streptosporangiaceae bacterium]